MSAIAVDRPSVSVEGVSFTYPGGTTALDGVDLTVAGGERVAIVGQNGSGKSTLMRTLNGLLRPSSGRVVIGGQDIASLHVAVIAATVGLAFQDPGRQIFAGRARAEVAFGPRNLGLRGTELDARIAAALETVGLTERAETNPYDLGFSQRKLLALASVLAMGTPVVVLDEPTTGQDARGVARVRAVVDALATEGRTVLAVSHDMRFVAETFGRVVVMRAGRIVLDGTPDEVFAARNWPALASTYLRPTLPARVGALLEAGDTATEASLVAALARRG